MRKKNTTTREGQDALKRFDYEGELYVAAMGAIDSYADRLLDIGAEQPLRTHYGHVYDQGVEFGLEKAKTILRCAHARIRRE